MASSTSRGVVVCLFVSMFALGSASAAVLVFPPPDGATRCQEISVGNSCATVVKFSGGSFMTAANGGSEYRGGLDFPYCVGPYISFSFQTVAATEASITIRNDSFSTNESLSMDVSDGFNSDGSPRVTTTRFPFPTGQSVTVRAAGNAIDRIRITVLNAYGFADWDAAAWAVTSMSATQPISPDVDLSLMRNADGTYSAVISYRFPAAGDLVLKLLPNGNEPAALILSRSGLTGSGTIVQPLDSFDTERTLQAIATACDGVGEAEASISGCSQCGRPATAVGSPIRLFDGVMTYTETDPLPSTTGREFRREYSSGASAAGPFGRGWSSIFDAVAMPVSADGKNVIVIHEDRTRAIFRLLPTGQWVQKWPAGGASGTLTGSEAAGYVFRDAAGSIVRTFGANHRLVRIQDVRRGRAVSIDYDAAGNPARIFDENGTWSCSITTASGLITTISVDGHPDLAWSYAYSGSLLTSVSVAGFAAPWRRYEYAANRLTAVVDGTGSVLERHDYNAAGRAISSYASSGDIVNIQYGASDANGIATTAVTRPDNTQATYQQGFAAGTIGTRSASGGCSSCGADDATAAYDAHGNLVRLQNARGYITKSEYDASGRQLIRTTTALVPAGCDPESDPSHCRLSADALAAASLASTPASQTTDFTYGDPNWPGRATQITRDSAIRHGGSSAEAFTFDPVTGEILVQTDRGFVDESGTFESHVTTTSLYPSGETAAFDPGGAFQSAWLSLPQPAGLRKSVTGPRTDVAQLTRYVYYPIDNRVPAAWRGQLAAEQNALGHVTRFQDYDVFGRAGTVIDANGVTTRLTFDPLGRIVTSTVSGIPGCNTAADPLCATDVTTTRIYAGTGPLATETRPAGNVKAYAYDSRGRLQTLSLGTSAALIERTDTTYDVATGQKSSEVLSESENGVWVAKKSDSYSYFSDGRLRSVIHADGTQQIFSYLADGTLSAVQDENHTAPNTLYAYDAAGRLSSVTQTLSGAPGGRIATSYSYDAHGNLTAVTDPNGNVTAFVFDDFGRMRRQTSPVSGTTTYTYDAAANLLTSTDANGAVTSRSYDALNRVTSSAASRDGVTESVLWTYDDPAAGNNGIGRLASMTDPSGSTAYRYERRGLLQSEAKTVGGSTYKTSYAYDANGNRSTLTDPSGLVTRSTFDFADRPYSMTAGATTIVSSAKYLPFGPLTTLHFGNGTTRIAQYDSRYRPIENRFVGASGTIADFFYASDNAGNITQIHDAIDASWNRDFVYDDLNRLTRADSGNSLWGAGAYTYDAMGNILASRWMTASLVGRTPKLDSVTENGVTRRVTYDAVGNELAVGTAAFRYSPRNTLDSAGTASYAYDGRNVLTIATIAFLAASVVPSPVTGGMVSTGTVTLNAPAAADTLVALSTSNDSIATVPPSITIAAGQTAATFNVATSAVAANSTATLTASAGQYTTTALLTVLPAQLASLTLPGSIGAGTTGSGTITLTGPAAVNVAVSLSSGNPAVTVPASVTIPAGSASATFPISAGTVSGNTTVTIAATMNGIIRQGSLLIAASDLATLSITPATGVNGSSFTGTVTLTAPAAQNVIVSLTASDSQVSLPSQITIAAGGSSVVFQIVTRLSGNAAATETIIATLGAARRQATITILPPAMSAFAVVPSAFIGGTVPLNGAASLSGAAPTSGWSLPVSSTNPAVIPPPAAVAVPPGATTGQATILTRPVLAAAAVTLSASDPNSITRSTTVTVQPAPVTLSNLVLSSSSVTASEPLSGTVTLTAPATAGGIEVDLQSDIAWIASVPPFVRVPAGALSASFPITTAICEYTTPSSSITCSYPTINISAAHSATARSVPLTVDQPRTHAKPFILSLTADRAVLAGGSSATGTVTLDDQPKGKGDDVTLSSSDPSIVSVPASVTVGKGSWSQTFPITVSSVAAAAQVTLTASCRNNAQQISLIVAPPGVATLSSLSLLRTGDGYLATVTLTEPAPAVGAVIMLGGSRENIISVPESVIVPAGSRSAQVLIRVLPFLGTQRGTIVTASYNGVTLSQVAWAQAQSAALPQARAVQCASLALPPCLTALRGMVAGFGDTSRYSFYTPELQLLAETETSANAAKAIAYSYLWFGGLPVASVETATSTVRWYATDHLGTPILQTDATGAVVWRAEYDPYGNLFTLRTGGTVHQPLRFPGQIAQDSGDLSYNVFRWYRPGWGRYTQADPLELAGGTNLFEHVLDNPVRLTDPLGLDTVGCDSYAWRLESPCELECCARHDRCYDQNHCGSGSWPGARASCGCDQTSVCADCNRAVVSCIARCGARLITYSDNSSEPNFYCPRQHRFIRIPGDFPDRRSAEAACEADHTEDCRISAIRTRPRPPWYRRVHF